jgi:hypothetical protein
MVKGALGLKKAAETHVINVLYIQAICKLGVPPHSLVRVRRSKFNGAPNHRYLHVIRVIRDGVP